jgi:hypothetical protein
VILELNGGVRFDDGVKKNQKVFIELLCDKNRTGLENLPNPNYEENVATRGAIAKLEEGEKEPELDGEPSLKFLRYDREGKDVDILRLEWRTKYACSPEDTPSQHWGFFTWFIIMYVSSPWAIFTGWILTRRSKVRLCRRLHTSSSAPGSTIIDTVQGAGICYLMAIRSAMYRIC